VISLRYRCAIDFALTLQSLRNRLFTLRNRLVITLQSLRNRFCFNIAIAAQSPLNAVQSLSYHLAIAAQSSLNAAQSFGITLQSLRNRFLL
jgi:hypothetical protein